MKNIYLISLASSLLFATTACEDVNEDTLFPQEYHKILYLNTYGEQNLTMYRTGENMTYQLSVIKSGSDPNLTANVSLETMTQSELDDYCEPRGLTYKALPASSVEIPGDLNFGIDERYKITELVLHTTAIYDYIQTNGGQVSDYVLPLMLRSKNDSVNANKNLLIIKPTILLPSVSFSKSGYSQNFFSDNGPVKMSFSLPLEIPVPSLWNFSCELAVDEALLDKYNQENNCDYALLPANAYTITTTVNFADDKTTTREAKIEVDRTGLSYGNYVLPVKLASCSKPEIEISADKSVSMYGISYVPDISKLTKVNLTTSMFSIYPDPTNEGSIAEMLDGKSDTYYHSNWGVGLPLPHWIQVALPKESTALAFEYQVRHNNNNGAPQRISLWGSTDGVTFGNIATIAENLPSNRSDIYKSPVFVAKPFKYLRVSVEKSPSGSFAFAEFRLSTN